jgi:hypothetical protein
MTTKRVPMAGTLCDTWFERGRSYVGLRNRDTDHIILEWWDNEVLDAAMDGFLDPTDWHGSAWDYARYIGAC